MVRTVNDSMEIKGTRNMNKRTPWELTGAWGSGQTRAAFHEGERALLRKRFFKRIKRVNVKKLMRLGLARNRKWLRLQLHRISYPTPKKTPVFILGCNRSGTNMVCKAIGKHPYGWDYWESDFSLAFNGYYLRAAWIIEFLIHHTPAPVISFGCILDSQFTNELLSRFQGARAIWVYRQYFDVANSCARMQWGYNLKDLVRWVARGELEKLGARGKRISASTVRLFSRLFREDLSIIDSACLYWYMRNQLYFNLGLHADSRVLNVQYEDTVGNKENAFRRIFGHLGLPFDPAVIEGIFASSVGKHPKPNIDSAIQEVCEALKTRLDVHYARTIG